MISALSSGHFLPLLWATKSCSQEPIFLNLSVKLRRRKSVQLQLDKELTRRLIESPPDFIKTTKTFSKPFFQWQCLYITTVSVHQRSIKARKCGHVISSASTNLAKNLLWNGRRFSWGKNWVRMPSLAHSAHASASATHLTLSQSTPASPDPCCSITLCQDRVQQHLKH